MIDLKKIREALGHMKAEDFIAFGMLYPEGHDFADDILAVVNTFEAERREVPTVALGPTREEQLTRYRCAMLAAAVGTYGTTYGQMAREIEGRAREQLDAADRCDEAEAAEKADEVPEWERLMLASARITALEAELETIRVALRRELDEGDLEACGPRDDLRALLPTKETPTHG